MALRALQGPTGGGAPVGGTGTTNTIPRWTGPSTLGDSVITQSGSNIGFGLGATLPLSQWHCLVANNAGLPASPQWLASFDAVGSYRSGLAFNFSGSVDQNRVAIQVANSGSGGTVTALVANGAGNVGIGTASPGYRLHVKDATNRNMIMTSGTTGMKITSLTDAGAEADVGVQGNTVQFLTGGTERARIDSNGNLVVGLSASASASTNRLQLANNSTAKQGIEFRPGVAIGGGTGNEIVNYDRNLSTYLGTEWSSSFFRLSLSGSYFEASTSGAGLKLNSTPGNTDPNTLDAYVDGGTAGGGGKTWTPADTSGAGLTLTVNSAQYVQVGKLVVMTADITYPVTASAAVAALSLPVSPAVNYFHAGSTGYQTTPAIAGLAPMVKNTAMNMWAYDTQQTNAQLSGKRLIFTVSYFMG